METSGLILTALATIFLLRKAFSWVRRYLLRKQMPPSLSGLPFLGNVLQVPVAEPWKTFAQWKEQLGPIFSLNMAGKPFVVLNTLEAVTDLLDHRSSIYSDRPRMIMAGEIICKNNMLALVEYGARWRKMRRAAHDVLHVRVVHAYGQHQQHDAAILIANLLDDPEAWDRHFRHAAASSSYSIMYGEHLASKSSYMTVQRNRECVHILANAVGPSTAEWVELFPWLNYIPEWLPGAGWKRRGYEQRRKLTSVFAELLDDVKVNMRNGTARPSMAINLIENQDKYGLTYEECAWLPGIIFLIGAETTGGALFVFLLAMTLFPEVLKRAQAEVDAVVGRGRMPSFDDQANLPYIEAMVKEVLRWLPGTPLAVPRRCMEDDWYAGYLIPKGATLLPNVWAISRDPKYFPNPDEFMPERFLDGDKGEANANAASFVFGFGRRMCPGKSQANRSLFIMLASMVWAFDIRKAKDGEGNEITPSSADCIDEGIVVRPAVFPCEISPRHPDVHNIVERAKTCSTSK